MSERAPLPMDQLMIVAQAKFRRSRHINESLKYVDHHRGGHIARGVDFNIALNRINHGIADRDNLFGDNNHPHVRMLRADLNRGLGQEFVPTFAEVARRSERKASFNFYKEALDATFAAAQKEFPEWADRVFPREETAAESIMLEGFGMFLGKLFGKSDSEKETKIRNDFVLAMMEILLVENPKSPIVSDMEVFIKQRIGEFSPGYQDIINKL